MALLQVRNLFKDYGSIKVLKNVSFDLAAGETLAVIGPNGAGKTTLFRSLTGESALGSGSVRFDGRDISNLPAHHRVRLGIGRTFQIARIFLNFTVFENVQMAVEARSANEGGRDGRWSSRKPSPSAISEVFSWLDGVGLQGKHDLQARYLSHGDKKKLEIGIALALKPRILMLDEPTAGMSPADRTDSAALIAKIRSERGLSIILTEHDMGVVFGLADRIVVLNYGEIIASGNPDEVRNSQAVRDVYLGQQGDHVA